MSFGGPKTPDIPPSPPTPTKAPEITAAKVNLYEKLRRMRGRGSTELVSPGFLVPAEISQSKLKSTLG